MKDSDFVFNYGDRLSYICHKISLNYGSSNKDFPDWIKNKKTKASSIKNMMINVFNILQQLHKVIKIGADSQKNPNS